MEKPTFRLQPCFQRVDGEERQVGGRTCSPATDQGDDEGIGSVHDVVSGRWVGEWGRWGWSLRITTSGKTAIRYAYPVMAGIIFMSKTVSSIRHDSLRCTPRLLLLSCHDSYFCCTPVSPVPPAAFVSISGTGNCPDAEKCGRSRAVCD